MTADTVLDLTRQAMVIILMLAMPILLTALVVGLLVGMFQAATQINELTLSFIPKLFAVFVVILIAGPWMLHTLVDFTINLFHRIPSLIG